MLRKDFWLALVGGSLIASGLSIFRTAITGSSFYLFMLLNLGLAWIPLVLAVISPQLLRKKQWFLFGITALLWLLFFPNTLYIITDFIHLKSSPPPLVVFDILMLFAFALNGIVLGLTSLYLIEQALKKYVKTEGLSLLFLILGSYGITIGRFLRWNSWDILLNPMGVISQSLLFFFNPFALTFTVLMSFFCILLYQLLRPILAPEVKS